jgi:hypothetical protein
VAAGAGIASGAVAQPASAATLFDIPLPPARVRLSLRLDDRRRQQRFLLSSTKPPVYLNGKTYPAEQRGGPDDGSYFIFNDENQSEKGGITVSSNGAQLSFDYPQVQGLTMNTAYAGKLGAAQLSMVQMPDPDIPVEELTRDDVPQRVLLGCSNAGDGSLLFLYDSAERRRTAAARRPGGRGCEAARPAAARAPARAARARDRGSRDDVAVGSPASFAHRARRSSARGRIRSPRR